MRERPAPADALYSFLPIGAESFSSLVAKAEAEAARGERREGVEKKERSYNERTDGPRTELVRGGVLLCLSNRRTLGKKKEK